MKVSKKRPSFVSLVDTLYPDKLSESQGLSHYELPSWPLTTVFKWICESLVNLNSHANKKSSEIVLHSRPVSCCVSSNTALEWEKTCYETVIKTHDQRPDLNAFAEKLRPEYEGR